MTIPDSGVTYIDALLVDQSWTGTAGAGATITYGFGQDSNSFSRSLQPQTNAAAIDPNFQQAVKSAMDIWSSYANIHFQQGNSSSTEPLLLALTNHDLGPTAAGVTYTYNTAPKITNVDVIVGTDYGGTELAKGNYGFFTVLHELGHALGLKHPFSGNITLPAGEDNWDHTIMAYDDGTYATTNNLPTVPMLYDIAAIQYLYGANHSTHSGNDRYVLTTGQRPSTLWDGGGVDTLDSSSYNGSATIDLREGATDVNHVGSTVLWIAFGSNIENAITGNGNDSISGNNLGNTLIGNAGNDTINGYNGPDAIAGNEGADNLSGGQGSDTIQGGKGADTIVGGPGNDLLHGGQGLDAIDGAAGNDTIFGDMGNDTLTGGAGNDIFVFDVIQNATDVVVDFVSSQDHLQFSHSLFSSTAAVIAAASYSHSTEIISLIGGGTVTVGNLGAALTVNDITIVG